MIHHPELFALPLENPVLLFSVLLLIIFVVPYFFEKIKLPSIIGLIITGAVVGEFGLNIISRNSSILLFGTIGILFIMFLAALEIDILEFKKFKFKSIAFGFLSFIVPMIIGTIVNKYVLHLSWISAILVASTYASHTLLSYPLASKLKIAKDEAITITVGGTMITDTLALLVLAGVSNSVSGELNFEFWRGMAVSGGVFLAIVLVVFPRVAHWFFKRFESGGSEQFLFVLALVFLGGTLAEVAGVEPIIGAFLVGLSINPLIPYSSILMNRLEFVGNTLFIPIFLISVGMLIDVSAFYNDLNALVVALVMAATSLFSKYSAAFLTSKIFKYTRIQRNLIFSLSCSQAAVALASALVGYRLGLLDKSILNGTVMMILVTSLVSSLGMQRYGKKQALIMNEADPDETQSGRKIFIAVSRPQYVFAQIDLAIYLNENKEQTPIAIGTVVEEDDIDIELKNARALLDKASEHIVASGNKANSLTRIDLNVVNGLSNLVHETSANLVILGWHAQNTTVDKIFGTKLDQFLKKCNQMIFVSNVVYNLSTTKRLNIIVPRFATIEAEYKLWLKTLLTLAKSLDAKVTFYLSKDAKNKLASKVEKQGLTLDVEYRTYDHKINPLDISRNLLTDDLLIFVNARKNSISHEQYMDKLSDFARRTLFNRNFMFVYPKQN